MSVKDKLIINTRPYRETDTFNVLLETHGARVIDIPMIKIEPIKDLSRLDLVIKDIYKYDGIFFTSTNSVKVFLDRLKSLSGNYSGKIYAVGENTGKAIESYGYNVSFIPGKFSSEELINSIGSEELLGKKFLFPCGSLSLRTIVESLKGIAEIDEIKVYETLKPYDELSFKKLKNLIDLKDVNCVAFFSPSAIDNFIDIIKEADLSNIDIAVIGNTTMKRAVSHKLRVKIKPEKSTGEALAKSIIEYYKNHIN